MSGNLGAHRPPVARSTGTTHRWVAVASIAVAVPALAGAIGLATGSLDMGETITERFPGHSAVLAGAALFTLVATPFAALAVLAWRGSRWTPSATVAVGLVLVAWIAVQLLFIRTLSFFQPAYAVIGLSFVWVGCRMDRHGRGTCGPGLRDHRPCPLARRRRTINP